MALLQTRGRDEDFLRVGEVWCLRDKLRTLLDALKTLGAGVAAMAYTGLRVCPTTTPTELQSAYKTLAKQYHPDRVASLGAELRALAVRRITAINAACQVLSS